MNKEDHLFLQLAASPFRSQLEQPLEILRGLSPALVKQALPIIDQLLPLYMDVADGRQEFTPAPAETQRRIQGFYGELSRMCFWACILKDPTLYSWHHCISSIWLSARTSLIVCKMHHLQPQEHLLFNAIYSCSHCHPITSCYPVTLLGSSCAVSSRTDNNRVHLFFHPNVRHAEDERSNNDLQVFLGIWLSNLSQTS